MSDLISHHTPAIRQRGTVALQQVPCLLLEAAAILLLQPVSDVKIINVIRSYISSCSEIEKCVRLAAAIDVGALQGASLTMTVRSSTSASWYLAQKQNKEAAIVKRQDETLMSMEEVLKFCYICLSAKI